MSPSEQDKKQAESQAIVELHATKLDILIMEIVSMRESIEENTKMIRMVFLVPLAMAAMGLAGWLLMQSKINQYNFLALTMVCLTPFFGEGVARILSPILAGKRAEAVRNGANMMFLLVSTIVFATH